MQRNIDMPDSDRNLPPCPSLPDNNTSGTSKEENEINLLDLFIVLLKHKGMIISLVLISSIAAVLISLYLPLIYRSECTITPTNQEKSGGALAALGGVGAMIASETGIDSAGSLEKCEVVLKSRELTYSIITKYDLLPVLFDKEWDTGAKRWKVEKPPQLEDGYNKIQKDLLEIAPDKKLNVIVLGFEMKTPQQAQSILAYYVTGLSDFLRQKTLADAIAQRKQLYEQLSKTDDPLLQNKLYELIARQIEKESLAKVQKNYSFEVIDPPFLPIRKYKPQRTLIVAASVAGAFFLSLFLSFFLEYIQYVKTRETPERLSDLRRYRRFGRK